MVLPARRRCARRNHYPPHENFLTGRVYGPLLTKRRCKGSWAMRISAFRVPLAPAVTNALERVTGAWRWLLTLVAACLVAAVPAAAEGPAGSVVAWGCGQDSYGECS